MCKDCEEHRELNPLQKLCSENATQALDGLPEEIQAEILDRYRLASALPGTEPWIIQTARNLGINLDNT